MAHQLVQEGAPWPGIMISFGSQWYNMDKNTVNVVLDVGSDSTIGLPLLIMAGIVKNTLVQP